VSRRHPRHPRRRRALGLGLAGLLGVGAALLVGCGSNAKLIPAQNASQLTTDFDLVASAVAAGHCGPTLTTAIAQTRTDLASLPSTIDPRLASALQAGARTLTDRAAVECTQQSTTTATTPTTTTPTTATSTSPNTTPTTTTPTTTTPTTSTPTTSTPTTSTPTVTTPPDTTPTTPLPDNGGGTPAPNGQNGQNGSTGGTAALAPGGGGT
jgi:hypothetical protein